MDAITSKNIIVLVSCSKSCWFQMVVDNLSHRPVHQVTGQIGHRPAHKPLNHRPTNQTEKINLEGVKQITTFEKYFQHTSVWIECLSAVTQQRWMWSVMIIVFTDPVCLLRNINRCESPPSLTWSHPEHKQSQLMRGKLVNINNFVKYSLQTWSR